MRRLVITETHGGLVTIETSAGVRSTGSSVQSALQKLDLTGLVEQREFNALANIFNKIRPIDSSNIGQGVASG